MKKVPALAASTAALVAYPIATVTAASGVINAIGVENEYADVIAQIGGKYAQVQVIETDPPAYFRSKSQGRKADRRRSADRGERRRLRLAGGQGHVPCGQTEPQSDERPEVAAIA
jgi:hypothetical protein